MEEWRRNSDLSFVLGTLSKMAPVKIREQVARELKFGIAGLEVLESEPRLLVTVSCARFINHRIRN
jgi:hypothetical protein